MLSRDEIWKVLSSLRLSVYRVCLTTIYSCGLRLLEGAHLRVEHVDGGRRLLCVPDEGGKSREIRDAALDPINHLVRHI